MQLRGGRLKRGRALHSRGVLALVALCLAGCSSQSDQESLLGDAGTLYHVTEGRVLAVREVEIDEETSNLGTLAGGLAGGFSGGVALGGQLGPGGALVGGAVGAAVGYLIEEAVTDRDGIEYVVLMEDGRAVTIVQEFEADRDPIPENSEVYVQTSRYDVRVVERSEGVGPMPSGEWRNPDSLPPGAESGKLVEIKRRRTGTYTDLHDRPPPKKERQPDTTYWPNRRQLF